MVSTWPIGKVRMEEVSFTLLNFNYQNIQWEIDQQIFMQTLEYVSSIILLIMLVGYVAVQHVCSLVCFAVVFCVL